MARRSDVVDWAIRESNDGKWKRSAEGMQNFYRTAGLDPPADTGVVRGRQPKNGNDLWHHFIVTAIDCDANSIESVDGKFHRQQERLAHRQEDPLLGGRRPREAGMRVLQHPRPRGGERTSARSVMGHDIQGDPVGTKPPFDELPVGEEGAVREGAGVPRPLRVLMPDHSPLERRPSDLDSLLPAGHRAHGLGLRVGRPDLTEFCEAIKAIEGGPGGH